MGILNLLRKKPNKENPVAISEDDYVLPQLEKGGYKMNEELFRRKEDEELLKKYGIVPENILQSLPLRPVSYTRFSGI